MLPQGYTRVEYIESTGTQKINTNVIPDASTVLDITFECKSGATTEHAIFGASWSINGFFLLAYSAAKGFRWHTGGKSVDVPVSDVLAKHRVICSTTSITVDGTQYTVNATQADEAYPIELFSVYHNDGNYGNKGVYRLYSTTIQQGGTLVRDYIPCRNPDGEAGLYDMVGGQFYGNDGTGEFVCGRAVALPEHYKRLAYIESTGTQFIDAEFKPNQSSRIIMDCLLTTTPTSNAALFGARNGSSAEFWTLYRASSSKFAFRYGGSGTNHFISGAATERHRFDLDKNTMTVDDAAVTVTSATFSSAYNAYLFAVNDAGSVQYPASVRLYLCQIYDNGTLVRDYIPCKTDTGVVGLYDMATAEFFGNNGTGEFIAGPEVAVLDDPNTLLLLHGEDLTDASQYAQVLASSGVTVSDAQSKFGGKSLYFNGSAKILLDAIDFGAGDFTVDWWEYVASSASSARFCTQYTTETASIKLGGILLGFAGTAVYASSDISTGAWDLISGVNMFSNTLNTWVHWAAVRSGTTFTTYRNGVKFATANISGAIVCDEQYKTVIGDYRAGDEEPFIGYLDEFRISDVARWTADFVPPIKPYESPAAAPIPPKALEFVRDGNMVLLQWTPSAQANVYHIYRDFVRIATAQAAEYTDAGIVSPAAYVYSVTAENQYGESEHSDTARVEYWGEVAPDLIYDRTMADVNEAKSLIIKYMSGENLTESERELWNAGLRGCYNTSDVNRVEYHTRELQSILNAEGYNIQIDAALWARSDIMRYGDIVKYLGNIEAILDAFGRSANAPPLPTIDQWINYIVANDIEKILFVTRELIYGALAMFRRAGTFTAGNDYHAQIIRRA